jgi:hypothetical protein
VDHPKWAGREATGCFIMRARSKLIGQCCSQAVCAAFCTCGTQPFWSGHPAIFDANWGQFDMLRKWLKARADRKRQQELAHEQARVAYEESLLSPDFGDIASVFGSPISFSLKALYEDETELRKSYVTKVLPGRSEDLWLFISCYNPLNKSQIKGQWLQDGIHFAFAGDGSGSEYVVDPTDDHAEIKFLEHEAGELKSTGVLMSEYLSLIDDQGNT